MADRPYHYQRNSVRVTNLIRLECYKAKDPEGDDSRRVLVVDDEGGIVKLLHAMLQAQGYELLDVARSGPEAVDKAVRRKPDVILMDIDLPGLDGIEAARGILDQYSCPLVFMSGLAVSRTLRKIMDINTQGYLVKPFSAEQLRTAIELAVMLHRRALAAETEVAMLRNEVESSKYIEAAVDRMNRHYDTDREQALEQLQAMANGRRCTLAHAARETIKMLDELHAPPDAAPPRSGPDRDLAPRRAAW